MTFEEMKTNGQGLAWSPIKDDYQYLSASHPNIGWQKLNITGYYTEGSNKMKILEFKTDDTGRAFSWIEGEPNRTIPVLILPSVPDGYRLEQEGDRDKPKPEGYNTLWLSNLKAGWLYGLEVEVGETNFSQNAIYAFPIKTARDKKIESIEAGIAKLQGELAELKGEK